MFVVTKVFPVFDTAARAYRWAARAYFRRRFASAAPDVMFYPLSSELSYGMIRVGKRVYIGPNAYFNGPIVVGDDVMFGPDVHVRAGSHQFDLVGKTIRESGNVGWAPVVIGDDVWVGGHASILRGVTIGEGAVVGAGAVVTHDVAPYVVVVGIPGTPVASRFDDETLAEHLRLRGRNQSEIASILQRRRSATTVHNDPVTADVATETFG